MVEIKDPRKPWQSKTIWTSLIFALTPFVPVLNAWIIANPAAFTAITGVVFAGLRTISDGKVSIS